MHRRGQSPTPLFSTISLVAIVSFIIAAVAIPAYAQNSVPPTAVQAAKMPQYASRLAHPSRRLLPETSAMQRAKARRGPLQAGDIYDNGPINGNTDAWTINFGYITSDSFNVMYNSTVITGLSFGAWLFSGDTLTSVEVSITSGENSGTSYFDQTVNFTQGNCTINEYGYNVCAETGSFNGPTLNAGTYWVNLQTASVPSGDPVYWDENSGSSLASQNDVGSIPSEAFTILGNATTTTTTSTVSNYACPAPQSGFHEAHDFGLLSEDDTPSGVVLGPEGNLYGTLATAGQYGAGVLYDLGQRTGHWFYSTLYNFLGGSGPGNPDGVIVGPQGALYGSASGGGTYGYGLIYKATPPANPCPTAICGWNVTTIYEFTDNTDGFAVTAFDSAGNLYGISEGGGAYGEGAVFELSPSQGGWTEKLLYSFTGAGDGALPNSLLVGLDGNLYGTTWYGGNNGCDYGIPCGVAFQLVPSAGGWTENVLHTFTGGSPDGWGPHGLIQAGPGSLVGISTCYFAGRGFCENYAGEPTGVIFSLSQSSGGWVFSNIYTEGWPSDCDDQGNILFHALTISAGHLYATEGGWDSALICDPSGCTEYEWTCGRVLDANWGLWPTRLVLGHADIFYNLTADANGNLYGTTTTCGFGTLQRNTGMVWQYSP